MKRPLKIRQIGKRWMVYAESNSGGDVREICQGTADTREQAVTLSKSIRAKKTIKLEYGVEVPN